MHGVGHGVDIDLRDAALIPGISWASNLAGPDKLFRWDTWMPVILADEADGYLGPFFNVFPLITIALFLIQQKMFTPQDIKWSPGPPSLPPGAQVAPLYGNATKGGAVCDTAQGAKGLSRQKLLLDLQSSHNHKKRTFL